MIQLQALQPLVVPALLVVCLYFLGSIPPIGRMFAFLFRLLKQVFASVKTWLEPFQPEKNRQGKECGGVGMIE